MSAVPSRSWLGQLLALALGAVVGFLAWQLIADASSTRPNPGTELAQTLDEPDFIRRIAGVARVLAQASPDTLDDLRPIIESYPAVPQDSERILFVEWWTRFDPEAAFDWAKADDIRHGQALTQHVLRVWARTDPLAALDSARRPSALRAAGTEAGVTGLAWLNESELAVMAGWGESAVPGVEEWVFDQPDMAKQQAFIQLYTRNRVAMNGAEEVWKWAQTLPEPYRGSMLLAAASAVAARDPDEAVRLTTPLLEAGETPGLAARVSARWCERDPEAALAWLVETPESKARSEAILECARSWIANSRADFLRFMEEQPDPFPTWLMPVVRLYARALEGGDEYIRGFAFVARLGETRFGDQATILILRKWLEDDATGAAAWIEDHPLPPEILSRAGYPGTPKSVEGGGV
jgi:hypothetical protein